MAMASLSFSMERVFFYEEVEVEEKVEEVEEGDRSSIHWTSASVLV